MAKKKYLIDGTTLVRMTDRAYTHAVIGTSVVDGKLFASCFCGRLDLAQKALQVLRKNDRRFDERKYEIREVHEVIKEKRDQ